MNDPLPDEIDEALWDEACRRAEAIRGFLMRRSGKVAAGNMALLAAELEVSRATAFRLIKLFRNGGTVMSLVSVSPAGQTAAECSTTSEMKSFPPLSTGIT